MVIAHWTVASLAFANWIVAKEVAKAIAVCAVRAKVAALTRDFPVYR